MTAAKQIALLRDALNGVIKVADRATVEFDIARAALAATAAPEQPKPVAERGTYWIERIMDQAQLFASSWAIYGSRLDTGEGQANAEQARADLRAMIEAADLAAPQQELDKDAARWQWVRDRDHKYAESPQIQAMWANCKTMYPSPKEWDAAIDAAIAATPKGETK